MDLASEVMTASLSYDTNRAESAAIASKDRHFASDTGNRQRLIGDVAIGERCT
jgi:hypothetical protein